MILTKVTAAINVAAHIKAAIIMYSTELEDRSSCSICTPVSHVLLRAKLFHLKPAIRRRFLRPARGEDTL